MRAISDFFPHSEVLGTPDGRGYVANLPTCGPLLILSPALSFGDPLDGKGYVFNLPTCGSLLILTPADFAPC